MINRTVKKYTVNTKSVNEDGKNYEVFTNLKKARQFAGTQLRADNFVSLLNRAIQSY